MRIVFCFVPCDTKWLDKAQNTLNQVVVQGVTSDRYSYFVARVNNNDYVCVHQSMVDNNLINVDKNLITHIVNEVKHKENLRNETISILVFRHHANGDVGVEINSFKETYLEPFINNKKNFDQLIKIPHLELRDPLIIIFTPAGREKGEWGKALNLKEATFYYDNNADISEEGVRIIEFKTNNYTILFVKENGLGKGNGGIDNLLEKILNHNKWKNITPKYVAVHALDDYLKDKSRFEQKVNFICSFTHEGGVHPDEKFRALLDNLLEIKTGNIGKAEKICDDIIEVIKQLAMKPEEKVAILKHRINHILGPVDLDLQRLEEIAKADDYITFYKELKNFRERYKDFDWNKIFEEVRKLIERFLKGQRKTLENFSSLKSLFCKDNNSETLVKAKNFLQSVKSEEIEKVFNEIKEKRNPLSSWLRELDKELDETIKEE